MPWRSTNNPVRLNLSQGLTNPYSATGLFHVRVGAITNTSPGVDIEWGPAAGTWLPRIDGTNNVNNTVARGGVLSLPGQFGSEKGTRQLVLRRTGAATATTVATTTWGCAHIDRDDPDLTDAGDLRRQGLQRRQLGQRQQPRHRHGHLSDLTVVPAARWVTGRKSAGGSDCG